MDLALECTCCLSHSKRRLEVSILVLMDLALEFEFYVNDEYRRTGFNPCFNGSCSRIVKLTRIPGGV